MILTKCKWTSVKYVRRDSDGTIWEPSVRDGYTDADAVADLLSDNSPAFYFRRIVWYGGWGWLCLGRGWYRTGEIWEPVDYQGWKVTRTPLETDG